MDERLFGGRWSSLAPYGEPIQQASRQGFETACLPRLLPVRRIEDGFALERIEVGADENRFL